MLFGVSIIFSFLGGGGEDMVFPIINATYGRRRGTREESCK